MKPETHAHRSLPFVVLLLLALAGCSPSGGALDTVAYRSSDDVYLVFRGRVVDAAAEKVPLALLGRLAFELQEGTHDRITSLGVAEIDHYYLWICLGRACIPVDPFTFSE